MTSQRPAKARSSVAPKPTVAKPTSEKRTSANSDAVVERAPAASSQAKAVKAVKPVKRTSIARPGPTGETHQRFPTTSVTDPKIVRSFAIEAARMLLDNKCSDIVVLDVTRISNMSDYIIVASGTSDRQMLSSGDDVAKLGEQKNYRAFRSDMDQRSTWIIVDFVDVVVHIFEPNTRAHYDLEMLWADADRLEWERPDQMNRNRAGLT